MKNTLFSNMFHAITDRQRSGEKLSPVPDSVRMDGKVVLITGSNSGLGKAVAFDCAKRNARVIMACRGGIPEAGEQITSLTGNKYIEMFHVDLSDLRSVHRLCDELASRQVRVDITVFNAGLTPAKAIKTPQGYEIMFAVHFLSTRVMMQRMLSDCVVRPSSVAAERPRIIFVCSESHQTAAPIDFDKFGDFVDYGMRGAVRFYAASNLIKCTYAQELSRRLSPSDSVQASVHSLCPGPIYSNISRNAPWFLKPIIRPLMKIGFQSPEKASKPITYLCCAESPGNDTGKYLSRMNEKPVSELASDPGNGRKLWECSESMVKNAYP